MPQRQLRPTLVRWEDKILAMAGDEDRHSLVYDTKADRWSWLPRTPLGHNISCNVCVNYNDLAVFTFALDGEFTLKSAVMPLNTLNMSESKEALHKSELDWALEVRKEVHQIDRFHIKQACVHQDGTIIVTGRGRLKQMKEQIGFLVMRFDVIFAGGRWSLRMQPVVLQAFATIFPRHLDTVYMTNDSLLLVDEFDPGDGFQAVLLNLDPTKKRRDGRNQQHTEHKICELVKEPQDLYKVQA